MRSPSASNWSRTASGALRAPWEVALFGIIVAAMVVVAGAIVLGGLAGTFVEGWARAARIPLDQWVTLVAVGAASVATVRIAHRNQSAAERAALAAPAWRPQPIVGAWVAGTMVIAVPVGLLLLGGAYAMAGAPSTEPWGTAAWGALLTLVPAALTEELLFRGVAFRAIADASGNGAAIAWTSVGFGAVHLFNPGPSVQSVLAVTVAGAFLGVVRAATGSLVAAWAAHLAINVTQAVAFHASLSGIDLPAPGYRLVPRGATWLTGGAWGPEGGMAVVAAMTVASFLVVWWQRRGPRAGARLHGTG